MRLFVYISHSQTVSIKRILQDPFRKVCHWWAPIELIRRFLFIIFITIDPGNLVSLTTYVPTVLCLFSCVYLPVFIFAMY